MAAINYSILFVGIILLFSNYVNCDKSPRVIIVGAGAAGIAAASRLMENNITNIKILEAKGRIGGRIYGVQFGDGIVDLGAQWVYGENNIVYELAKDFDILQPGEHKITLYHSSHQKLDLDMINELYNLFHRLYIQDVTGPEVTLGDLVEREYNDTILSKFENDKEKLTLASDFLNFLLKAVLMYEGAFSAYDVAAKSDLKKCELHCATSFKGIGYNVILDILMKRYTSPNQSPIREKIIFGKEVIKAAWDKNDEFDEKLPLVQCLDGTIYKGDHIIFTPSLGVLKYNYNTIFVPSLSKEKITAIREVGYASVFKAYIHFQTKWWPSTNFSDFSFLWADKDRQLFLNETSDGYIGFFNTTVEYSRRQLIWLLDLVAIYAVPENPNVLEAIFCGEHVPRIESFTDQVIMDGIMLVLNRFVVQHFENIPNPDSIVRHNWYSDPHFRGTFAFQTVPSRKIGGSQESVLAEPVLASSGKYTLLFAGEATHPTLFSTVYGAIETGYREADRIIGFYKQKEAEKQKNSTQRQ